MTVAAPVSNRPLKQSFPRITDSTQFQGRELQELEALLKRTREFCDVHVRPRALEFDRRAGEDPRDFPWDLAAAGARAGMFSLMLPQGAGGESNRLCVRSALVMEELGAACSGVATIFGAHALGLTPLVMLGPAMWDGVMRDIFEAEKRGEPLIFAAAITEPAAGTDYENPQLVRDARLNSHAEKVAGGYRITSTKRFISNGSVADWIVVLMPVDPKRPFETMAGFLVDGKSEGLTVDRVEHKMGQRACPAAELVLDNVFVPDDKVLGKIGDGVSSTMGVLIASRPVVGAIATGIARGAYERLLEWLINDPEGQPLLERQQVQLALAQMEEEVHLARQAYLDAATEFDSVSLGRILQMPVLRMLGKLPSGVRSSRVVQRQLDSELSRAATGSVMRENFEDRELTRALAMSSMAKARGGDTAMKVTGMALEIAGLSSGPIRAELEKLLRDAKLTQIYEGTNQLNRLEVFEGLVVERELEMLPDGKPSAYAASAHPHRQATAADLTAKLLSLGARKNGGSR